MSQTVFHNLYDQAKSFQKTLLHAESSLTHTQSVALRPPASVSASSAFSVSSLPCPNPSHPMSFTCDMWSGPDPESYICVTAHWLDNQWDLHHALLDIYLCTDRHTDENIADWLKQIWKDNDLSV